jgi:hypothetical protein
MYLLWVKGRQEPVWYSCLSDKEHMRIEDGFNGQKWGIEEIVYDEDAVLLH